MILDRNKQTTVTKVFALLLVACILASVGSVAYSAEYDRVTLSISTDIDKHQMGATIGSTSNDRSSVADGSWPMAGANPQRTSWTSEEVRGDLKPVWYKPIEPYISHKVQIIAAYDTLYIATAKGLYALSTEDMDGDGLGGDVKWVYPTELPLGNSPTIHEGVAYFGGFDHKMHAIDADPNLASLPVDPQTGFRVNGQRVWQPFEADAGFQTNPLIIDHNVDPSVPVGQGKLFAGSRDGNMYAIHTEGPNMGELAWQTPYQTGGPILFSAAYKEGVIYFASNDSYAYALNGANGSLVWKSAKLPGAGFHSWWPVVYTDPQTQTDYVVFAGSNNYRFFLKPGPLNDIQLLEIGDLYGDNGIPNGSTIAPIGPDGSMDVKLVLQYYEQKPWRRTYFVLNAATGQELTFNYQRPNGSTGVSYAPITWLHTHGPGNRYPPSVGPNGLLYQPMNYVSNPYIARGGIVGWDLGSSSVRTTGHSEAMDEPVAYSVGGNLIYWVRNNDRVAGAFDINDPDQNWLYYSYDLPTELPGYDELYTPPCGIDSSNFQGANDSVNGIYGRHGEQNPPIPYEGKVYMHRSNSIIAFGDHNDPPAALPIAPAIDVSNAQLAPRNTEELQLVLSQEVQKILNAGHLRPGYLGSGLFDVRTKKDVGDYILDYWHNPADILNALLVALPHLPTNQQSAVRTYLQAEFAAYPPHQQVHIGWRDGVGREAFDLPPEVESDLDNFSPKSASWDFSGWDFPPHTFYALWKYAEEFGGAQQLFNNSRNRLESAPSNQYLADWPQVHNAYIAGYWGYLELEALAGYSESTDIRSELNRLLALRVSNFSKDSPLGCGDRGQELNISRNFMYLVPELGQYLHDQAFSAVQEAVDEYAYVAPYWFVTKTEQTLREGVIQNLYDSSALFQARAFILKESREELLKYLDVPAFERGDLFYLHKLVATIEASPMSLQKTVSVSYGDQGDYITYSLLLRGGGGTLYLTDSLPNGASGPVSYELEQTSVTPSYNGSQHTITWSDAPAAGQEVVIVYTVQIAASDSRQLVNTAQLSDGGAENEFTSVSVMANPHQIFLPVVLGQN